MRNNNQSPSSEQDIVVRFPPSPTGNFHIGGARTALFNYLFAKRHGGKFYIRIEDTDRERSKPEFEKNILDSLAWLGFSSDPLPDGKPFWRQSERTELYRAKLEELVTKGFAYLSKESEGDRKEVVRFKNPGTLVTFHDIIRGAITFDTKELGDFVIAKSLQEPLYHLAVVVDDAEMGVTHVIRGEDHISNTPRQILIGRALGFKEPKYVHIPLILAPDKSKLSKRHGAVALTEYRELGYLSEAIINYLVLLGWNPGTDKEFFSLADLTKEFDFERVQKGGAVFNIEKLEWINKHWIRELSTDEQRSLIEKELIKSGVSIPPHILPRIIPLISDRIGKWSDVEKLARAGEFDYFAVSPTLDTARIQWKTESRETTRENLKTLLCILNNLKDTQFSRESLSVAIMPYAEEKGKGAVLWPMRFALSGKEKSPDPLTLAEIFGKEETLRRLTTAIDLL